MSWKIRLLSAAEVADAWRIFPRIFLFAYGFFCYDLSRWYMALKAPTTEQTAFATAIIGLAVPLTGWYMGTGRTWTK